MDSLRDLAARFDEAAASVNEVAIRVGRIEPPASAFGVDGPGGLAERGRDLYGRWAALVGARAREAAEASARLTELAAGLRQAARAYTEIDDVARRRHDYPDSRARPPHDPLDLDRAAGRRYAGEV